MPSGGSPDAGVGDVVSAQDGPGPSEVAAPDALTDVSDDTAVGDAGDAAWRKIAHFDTCPLFEADLTKTTFAPRVWSACGDGCLAAPAARPDWAAAYSGSLSADVVGGELLWRVEMARSSPAGPERLVEVSKVVDGTVIGAVIQRDKLTTCIPPVAATMLMTFRSAGQIVHGRVRVGMPIQWQGTVLKEPARVSAGATWDSGALYAFEDGSIRSLTSPAESSFAVVEPSGSLSPVYVAASGRDQVLWRSLTTAGSELKAYSAGATRTLASATYVIQGLAQSETRLAWIAARGPSAASGLYTSAELVVSKFATLGSDVVPVVGPSFPVAYGLKQLKTWGDYAATLGCESATDLTLCSIFVVHIATKTLTKIPHRPGTRVWRAVYALSSDELLLGEADAKGDPQLVETAVRLKLARLSDFAKW